jgi:phenylalanyl-tRNA synthetase alpha chain
MGELPHAFGANQSSCRRIRGVDPLIEVPKVALIAIDGASSLKELKEVHTQVLGKSGSLAGLMAGIGMLKDPEQKREYGKSVNQAKVLVEGAYQARLEILKAQELQERFQADRIDMTMPGRKSRAGYEHILQLTANKIRRVLGGLGFQYVEGPELEQFKYNFTGLNYPPDHPAMDDQDTFYITDDLLLRTQGTAVQPRMLEIHQPPLRFVTIGRTFRNEAVDRTHNHTFHQVDCFMVDENVSMAHLKGTLGLFARAMFGADVKVRFRPDFFPFVEPGVDYAISTPKLFNGRWVELGGAGLIHPNILRSFGIDSERFSGFAFGLGVERIPMMAYGVDDLRVFLENDLRFLEQFHYEPTMAVTTP